MPLGVTAKVSLRRADLRELLAGGPLSRLMALQAELHAADNTMSALTAANPGLPADMLNFQYDSLAVAAGAGGAEWVLEDLGDVPRVVEILGS